MAGRHEMTGNVEDRTVELEIDGKPVHLNGFVMDVFRETMLALVRALGDEDEKKAIQIFIGASGK